MNFKCIIPTLALALLVSGCGSDTVSDNSSEAQTTKYINMDVAHYQGSKSKDSKETSASASSTKTPEVDPNAVTKEELAEFTTLFNTPEYNGFLTKSFSNTSEIDWEAVMNAGGGINAYSARDGETEEIKDYLKMTNYDFFSADNFIIVRRSDLEDFAQKHTGEALNSNKRTIPWTYMDKYDSFYHYYWSYEGKTYTCVSGEKNENDYTLHFRMDGDSHVGTSADRTLTLTKEDNGLLIRSNAIQWDDGCDPDQTFDIDLNDNGDNLRFVSYKGYSSAARYILTKDGNEVSMGTLSVTRDDKLVQIKEIAAVGFFDFNADGRKDIVCIGDSEDGRHLVLYESVDSNYYYEQCDADEAIEKMIDGDITLNKIKKALLGDNTDAVYNTYNEAYAQVARLYNLSNNEYGYEYGLIDGNGDAVPELVINGASSVSLFTFEDGHIHCLMQKWGWGAMGNHGYEYAPGKNVYFNDNADYAGAIHYDYFMMPREGQELSASYSEKTNHFEDKDRNGFPTSEELDANADMEFSESFYYNHTDVEMTNEELEQKINELWSYDYKMLCGDVDYDGLIAVLKNS